MVRKKSHRYGGRFDSIPMRVRGTSPVPRTIESATSASFGQHNCERSRWRAVGHRWNDVDVGGTVEGVRKMVGSVVSGQRHDWTESKEGAGRRANRLEQRYGGV
jgi:hypothetical protein